MSTENTHEDDNFDETDECESCGQTVDSYELDENGECDKCAAVDEEDGDD